MMQAAAILFSLTPETVRIAALVLLIAVIAIIFLRRKSKGKGARSNDDEF